MAHLLATNKLVVHVYWIQSLNNHVVGNLFKKTASNYSEKYVSDSNKNMSIDRRYIDDIASGAPAVFVLHSRAT